MKLYHVLRDVSKFRTSFDFGGRDVAHWFPGHMAKGDGLTQSPPLAVSVCACVCLHVTVEDFLCVSLYVIMCMPITYSQVLQ